MNCCIIGSIRKIAEEKKLLIKEVSIGAFVLLLVDVGGMATVVNVLGVGSDATYPAIESVEPDTQEFVEVEQGLKSERCFGAS